MDIKRLITTLVGLPLVALVLIVGNVYLVDIAFAIIAIMSLHEYFDSFKEKAHPIKWIAYLLAAGISLLHVIPNVIDMQYIGYVIGALIPISVLVLFISSIVTSMKKNIMDLAVTLFGICYIGLFILFIPLIHGMDNGKILIWFPIIAAWGTDIFAYLGGTAFGKHKFTPISPNKSIEGCICGTLGGAILILAYAAVCNNLWAMHINYGYIAIVACILSLLGQIGDLAASSIKRHNGVKDFSNLIPGHGGMLDRIDSIIFIAPFAYFLLLFLA